MCVAGRWGGAWIKENINRNPNGYFWYENCDLSIFFLTFFLYFQTVLQNGYHFYNHKKNYTLSCPLMSLKSQSEYRTLWIIPVWHQTIRFPFFTGCVLPGLGCGLLPASPLLPGACLVAHTLCGKQGRCRWLSPSQGYCCCLLVACASALGARVPSLSFPLPLSRPCPSKHTHFNNTVLFWPPGNF